MHSAMMKAAAGNQYSGQQLFTSSGTFTAPAGVTSVCVVCIGAGGGAEELGGQAGSGGGLGYINNYAVTPGNNYDVVVGQGVLKGNGGNSYFVDTATCCGFGGVKSSSATSAQSNGGAYVGDGGGNGGNSGYGYSGVTFAGGGGGGAGGYSGNGGNGGYQEGAGANGAGGGGGGGGAGQSLGKNGGNGGGVGVLGSGSNGTGGAAGSSSNGDPGTAGSGGSGSTYGGGAGGDTDAAGANGAVRIIWGDNRSFPSTNTGDF